MASSEKFEFSGVHGGIVPANVRETDFVHARVKVVRGSEAPELVSVRVWRMSPLGVELVQDESNGVLFQSGDAIDLQLVIEGRRTEFHGRVIDLVDAEEGVILIGVRFLVSAPRESGAVAKDDRTALRWICSEEHIPRAVAPAPGHFNEFIGFKIQDISRSGLLLSTTLANGFLVPGMRLTLSVHLPMVAETVIRVEIVRLRIGTAGAEEILEVGVTILEPTPKLLSLLGQYLVQFSKKVDLEQLVSDGFIPDNMNLGITFFPLQREEDFLRVLDIRKLDWLPSKIHVDSFADERDRKARIIVGKLGEDLIATARIRYPSIDDSLSSDADGIQLESSIRMDSLIEVSGIALAVPQSIRRRVLLAMFRYICTSCTSSERHTVVVFSNRNDSEVFERAGWRRLGIQDQIVLVADAYRAIQGTHVSPLDWNYIWRPVADYLVSIGEIRPSGPERIMLKLFRLFGFLSNIVFHFKKMPSNIQNFRGS